MKDSHFFLDECDVWVPISKCDHLALSLLKYSQKLRILGGTLLHLVPTLSLEYLAVSTERPELIFF